MIWIKIIGFTAATLSTIAFLPQVIKTWRTKQTRDLSLGLYIIMTCATFLWSVYGLIIKDFPLILANSVTFLSAASILFLKIKKG